MQKFIDFLSQTFKAFFMYRFLIYYYVIVRKVIINSAKKGGTYLYKVSFTFKSGSKTFCSLSDTNYRSNPPEVFSGKVFLKICSKFTGEHPCRSVISIKLLCYFIESALRNVCSSGNLLNIVRAPLHKNTSKGLLL